MVAFVLYQVFYHRNSVMNTSLISKNGIKALEKMEKVVSSNPVHGEVYSIQHYVIKFVSDL